MADVVLRVRRLSPERDADLPLPRYMTSGAAGMDVVAANPSPILLSPMARGAVETGLAVAVPNGYELQVRPRSGLAMRHGLTVLNAPGTVDSDYRGEVKILLINLGTSPVTITRGERIAQWVIAPVVAVVINVVGSLDETVRGDGGFGHTGR